MDLTDVRSRCTALIADLTGDPPDGQTVGRTRDSPLDADTLAVRLSQRRGRRVHVLSHTHIGEPSGLWIASERADYVFYDAALAGMHREHVVAHELAHIAFGHGSDDPLAPDLAAALLPDVDPSAVRGMLQRSSYTDAEEQEAEVFASLLFQLPDASDLTAPADLPAALRDQARGMARTFGSRRAHRR